MTRLRARWVLPVCGEPIENGEVVVDGDRILELRHPPLPPFDTLNGTLSNEETLDLGNSILMPGLVNVHAHIDYTVMRGLLEDLPFFTWIRELTERKAALEESDWIASATMGAAEAVAGGVTTLGDCTDSGAALLGAKALGLRGIIYQEVFSLDESEPVENIVSDLDLRVAALRWQATGTRLKIGISPHAPYTVRPSVFSALSKYAGERKLPSCIHVAESQAETDWLRTGGGVIGERFRARGFTWMTPPPGVTGVAHLDSLGAIDSRTLLVHGVQVSASDRDAIRRAGAAWAHCPKSNAKLANGIAPLGILRGCYDEGGERIGLGSDSVASNNTMDLFEEMRFAVLAQRARSRKQEAMTARQAVEMATIGGARALGMEDQIGTLEPGKQADIIGVSLDSLSSAPCYDPYSAIVYAGSARDVRMTMIAGQTIYDSGRFLQIDMDDVRARFERAVGKMCAWTPQLPIAGEPE